VNPKCWDDYESAAQAAGQIMMEVVSSPSKSTSGWFGEERVLRHVLDVTQMFNVRFSPPNGFFYLHLTDVEVPTLSTESDLSCMMAELSESMHKADIKFRNVKNDIDKPFLYVHFDDDGDMNRLVNHIEDCEPNWVYWSEINCQLCVGLKESNDGCPGCGGYDVDIKIEDECTGHINPETGKIVRDPAFNSSDDAVNCARCGFDLSGMEVTDGVSEA
jgi:hypothetical protein